MTVRATSSPSNSSDDGRGCARYAEAIAALVDEAPEWATDHVASLGRPADSLGPVATGPSAVETRDHMAACVSCRRLFDELTQISTLAGTLEPLCPPDRVWDAISERVAAENREPAMGHRVSSWAMAGGAVAAAAALIFAFVLPTTPGPDPVSGSVGAPQGVAGLGVADVVERPYRESIQRLERLGGDRVVVGDDAGEALSRSLGIIDAAIAESRLAVSRDPASAVARARLQAGLRQKVEVLRTATRYGIGRR